MSSKLALFLVVLWLIVGAAQAATTYTCELVPTFSDYSVPIRNDNVLDGVWHPCSVMAGGFHGRLPSRVFQGLPMVSLGGYRFGLAGLCAEFTFAACPLRPAGASCIDGGFIPLGAILIQMGEFSRMWTSSMSL